ncbi:bacillithiol system redox-active protein YtxJ [Flavobacterium hauense]
MGIIAKYPGQDYYLDYVAPPTTEWTNLISPEQLKEVIKESFSYQVVIFKHSTRCDQSNAMLKNFERRYDSKDNIPKPYFLDLIAHRELSDEIALRFDVKHESPQVILVNNGVATQYANHIDIASINFK